MELNTNGKSNCIFCLYFDIVYVDTNCLLLVANLKITR